MTEDEAKTKWCPHTIASHTDPRQHMGDRWLHNCIASACMAWRWRIEAMVVTNDGVVPLNKGGPHGYCGLARVGR